MLEQILINVVHSTQFQAIEVLSAYFVGDAAVKAVLSLKRRPNTWNGEVIRPFDLSYLAGFLRKYVDVLGPFAALAALGQLEHQQLGTDFLSGLFWAAIVPYTAQELGGLVQAVKDAFPGASVPAVDPKPESLPPAV